LQIRIQIERKKSNDHKSSTTTTTTWAALNRNTRDNTISRKKDYGKEDRHKCAVRYGWAERFSRSGNSPEAARRAEGLSDGPCSQSNPASSNLGLGNEAKGTFPCLPLTCWNSFTQTMAKGFLSSSHYFSTHFERTQSADNIFALVQLVFEVLLRCSLSRDSPLGQVVTDPTPWWGHTSKGQEEPSVMWVQDSPWSTLCYPKTRSNPRWVASWRRWTPKCWIASSSKRNSSVGLPQGQRGIQVLDCLNAKRFPKCLGCLNAKGNPSVGCFKKEVTCHKVRHLAPNLGAWCNQAARHDPRINQEWEGLGSLGKSTSFFISSQGEPSSTLVLLKDIVKYSNTLQRVLIVRNTKVLLTSFFHGYPFVCLKCVKKCPTTFWCCPL
jgi:hypothetical protein